MVFKRKKFDKVVVIFIDEDIDLWSLVATYQVATGISLNLFEPM